MDARWEFPCFPRTELEAQLLALCSPVPSCLPLTVSAYALLARSAELDLFPLAFDRLRRAGAALGEPWQRRFRANAACNLYLRAEQGRLLASLQAAGVPAAPLKGIALAELAYGDSALRAQVDIDLYVPPRRLAAAFRVLSACGYRAASPNGVSPQALARTGDEYTSECCFEPAGAPLSVPVELHWRVLPMSDRAFEAALLPSGGAGFALPPALDFLSLCVRLAADRWRNLKLLADLAHWMVRPSFAWQPVLEAAQRLRLRRLLAIALMAVRAYFGVAAPAWVREALSPAATSGVARAAVVNPFVFSP
ncbi:MAG: nucleotidyltransferase family protein, partial [Terriglobia bacterium]